MMYHRNWSFYILTTIQASTQSGKGMGGGGGGGGDGGGGGGAKKGGFFVINFIFFVGKRSVYPFIKKISFFIVT